MLIIAILLLSLSTTVIFTSNSTLAIEQLIYGVAGVAIFWGLRSFDYHYLRQFIKPGYITILGLLIITLLLGFESRGSVRWIPLGIFNFQPSEFAKPILILTLADFWASHKSSWRNIALSVLLLSPLALLIFRQPDLGTTLTVVFIWLSMLLASNISIIKLVIMGFLGAIILPLGWFFLQDYQKNRLLSFLSPMSDPEGRGFHAIQSMIAVGSGELWGRGLGRGTQSRLQFLPEFRTDFIFAFISEELGFVGCLILLGLYASLFFVGFKLLEDIHDRFGELIIVGVLSMLFFQITINVGMNIGLLPITGITLPLLSYGGSSVLTTMISLGLVSSVEHYSKHKKDINLFSFD
jgi:rod shape determining protein RodA